ncbi:carbohydrate ABC transporter permease [Paenibacillus radicis (ex Gao et al. 2016)]|uniref:Sugar ABC transporter permease n=1 Tax=Paenibacillus radicis (ex Gao et al. 2016) TaxID=1737354 RepID=A0A917M733_9BACL|nr:carbohydrate ABC transporter permease [Paenibacillus radicis (ex Gao et al. 2016)]GGG83290.1 sugar ABC transporter permease [Paenibacillus radicis (ex Gao et al. 2016)]
MTLLKKNARWLLPLFGIIVTAVFLFPLYWLAATSFKTEAEIFQTPQTWFPHQFQIESYTEQLTGSSVDIFAGFRNSLAISVGALIISTLLAIPASYGVARFRFPGRHLFVLLFLVTQMLPASLILTPLFLLFKQLGLIGPSYWSTILANATAGIPFAVIILRTYFVTLPKELEESAKIDGCNTLTTFFRIMLPIAVPGVVVAIVFSFLFAWGDLIYGMTFISKESLRPITAGIYNFLGFQSTSWNNTMAFGTVSIIPVALLFIFVQRYIVSGLTNGAVKG